MKRVFAIAFVFALLLLAGCNNLKIRIYPENGSVQLVDTSQEQQKPGTGGGYVPPDINPDQGQPDTGGGSLIEENATANPRVCRQVSSDLTLTDDVFKETPGGPCLEIVADNVKLDCNGHHVYGPANGGETSGIYANGRKGLTIMNCRTSAFAYGILLINVQGAVLANNTAQGAYESFKLVSSSGNTLQNNIATQSGHYGFYLLDSSGNTLTNNNANSNGWSGYYLRSSKGNSFVRNYATANTGDGFGLAYGSDSNAVSDNTANMNKGAGVALHQSSSNTFMRNTVTGNSFSFAFDNQSYGSGTNVISANSVYGNIQNSFVRDGAVVQVNTQPPVKVRTTHGDYIETTEQVCKNGKAVIVRLFSSSWCPHCQWEKPVVQDAVSQFGNKVELRAYETDTTGAPMSEMAIFSYYDPEGTIPTIIIGCKYYKTGSGERIGESAEKLAIMRLICNELGSDAPSFCLVYS